MALYQTATPTLVSALPQVPATAALPPAATLFTSSTAAPNCITFAAAPTEIPNLSNLPTALSVAPIEWRAPNDLFFSPLLTQNGSTLPFTMGPENGNEQDAKKVKLDSSSSQSGAEAREPSRVVHIRGLPIEVTESDIINLGVPFGRVKNILLVKKRGQLPGTLTQAFLEMQELEDSEKMINYYNFCQTSIRGRPIYMQYSNHKELSTDSNPAVEAALQDAAALRGGPDGDEENTRQVLRVIVENVIYTVTLDMLKTIFSKYGDVIRIITFTKNNNFQALIEMGSPLSAHIAKMSLDGQNIFTGCCSMRVDFSKLQKLQVKYNNDKSRDYTNPDLPQGNSGGGGGTTSSSTLDLSSVGGGAGGAAGGGAHHSGVSAGASQVGLHHGGLQHVHDIKPDLPSMNLGVGALAHHHNTLDAGVAAVAPPQIHHPDFADPSPFGLSGIGGGILGSPAPPSMAGSLASPGGVLGGNSAAAGVAGGGLSLMNHQAIQALQALQAAANATVNNPAAAAALQANLASSGLNAQAALYSLQHGLQNLLPPAPQGGGSGGLASAAPSLVSQASVSHHHQQAVAAAAAAASHHHQQQASMSGGLNVSSMAGSSRQSVTPGGGCVLLLSNLDETKVTPDALFTLFGVYGDVTRVKILYNKKDSALIQFKDGSDAARAMLHLTNCPLFGREIRIQTSKHTHVSMPKEDLEEGGLTKDYTGSPLHRFKNPGSKNYNNICQPSCTLHLSNIPNACSEETVITEFEQLGHKPVKFRFFPKDHKMALIQLESTEEAVEALIDLHNIKIDGLHLRVSFSKTTIVH